MLHDEFADGELLNGSATNTYGTDPQDNMAMQTPADADAFASPELPLQHPQGQLASPYVSASYGNTNNTMMLRDGQNFGYGYSNLDQRLVQSQAQSLGPSYPSSQFTPSQYPTSTYPSAQYPTFDNFLPSSLGVSAGDPPAGYDSVDPQLLATHPQPHHVIKSWSQPLVSAMEIQDTTPAAPSSHITFPLRFTSPSKTGHGMEYQQFYDPALAQAKAASSRPKFKTRKAVSQTTGRKRMGEPQKDESETETKKRLSLSQWPTSNDTLHPNGNQTAHPAGQAGDLAMSLTHGMAIPPFLLSNGSRPSDNHADQYMAANTSGQDLRQYPSPYQYPLTKDGADEDGDSGLI